MNFLVVIIYSLIFSFTDYWWYNTAQQHNWVTQYRVVQFAEQGAITWKLANDYSWREAVGFNVMWWTWLDDWMYYGWSILFNHGGGWDNRAKVLNGQLRHVTWAGWTPYGIVQNLGRGNKVVPFEVLVGQSFIGVTVSFSIMAPDAQEKQ